MCEKICVVIIFLNVCLCKEPRSNQGFWEGFCSCYILLRNAGDEIIAVLPLFEA